MQAAALRSLGQLCAVTEGLSKRYCPLIAAALQPPPSSDSAAWTPRSEAAVDAATAPGRQETGLQPMGSQAAQPAQAVNALVPARSATSGMCVGSSAGPIGGTRHTAEQAQAPAAAACTPGACTDAPGGLLLLHEVCALLGASRSLHARLHVLSV